MYGYSGKILEIDLTTGRTKEWPVERQWAGEYLSGLGFNARFLFQEIGPGADPLGPENVLTFGVGVLVGTNVPTASRTEASALSPATGLFGTANSGNFWGSELKFAGFDGLVVRGKAPAPVYVWICDEKVSILPASHLWGRDAWETIRQIRRELGDRGIQVAAVGPAGENLVRFASIENGPFDAWARTGLGAVMGSKNLKAVAVRGRGPVRVARKKEFLAAVEDTRQAILSSPFYGSFSRFGTMLATLPYQEFGALPGRNYRYGAIEGWEQTRSRKVMHKYTSRGVACIACPIACAHWVDVQDGPYAGLKLKDMEVTPVIGFGAGCDVNNLPAIALLTETCQRLGMDMVSAAAVVAFAMELYENGLLAERDMGFPLPWGDEGAIISLLEMIARRRGVGDILAEGVKRAAGHFPGARQYTAEVKGLECFLLDPRARWSTWTLGYITNVRGGDHLRTRNPVENLRYNDNPAPYFTEKFGFPDEMYDRLDMPEQLKREIFDPATKDVNIPRMSKWAEDLISVYNALGMCIRPPVLHTVGPTLFARLYSSLTGIDVTPEEIIRAGERIWNVQKLFNLRHGEGPADSDYPARFYDQPVAAGPAAGRRLDRARVREVRREYYLARGWDKDTGVPGAEKLAELNLLEMGAGVYCSGGSHEDQ
ncbi:aldehyde ferredoxin oxidoreductase [Desulfofundulus thermobenzoicus]|uniref:Aldehyde ferredoxin oxidoreductase n=1 Tax=Desulfofundulus thermobenzoicus TaxID=29376 RepID=A0A6N7IM43_9FIRM|nr:aldehyde ferredoxin oxidoreductase [Desulfofundulus thermobenzoicus]